MGDVSITLTGPADWVQRILEVWVDIPRRQESTKVVDAQGLESQDVEGFCTSLTEPGSRVVEAIAERSLTGKKTLYQELCKILIVEAAQLNGIMGGIGRHWHQAFASRNPFLRKTGDHPLLDYYQVPKDVADPMLKALKGLAR